MIFSIDRLHESRRSLQKFDDFILRLEDCNQKRESTLHLKLENLRDNIRREIADDLHIDRVLALLYPFMKSINAMIDQDILAKEDAEKIMKLLEETDV